MNQSLFERLGGDKGISKIVDNTVQQRISNPAINARFLPLKEKPELLATIKQHKVNFLLPSVVVGLNIKEKICFLPI
jgi:hemoglobin